MPPGLSYPTLGALGISYPGAPGSRPTMTATATIIRVLSEAGFRVRRGGSEWEVTRATAGAYRPVFIGDLRDCSIESIVDLYLVNLFYMREYQRRETTNAPE